MNKYAKFNIYGIVLQGVSEFRSVNADASGGLKVVAIFTVCGR